MGIYLGCVGNIELTRKSLEGSKTAVVNGADVNASRGRFSFDFDPSFLNSGDFVEIKTTDGTDLSFVSAAGWGNGIVQSSGNWYIFVDELGGIKLYNTFGDSLEGGSTGRVPLVAITRNIPIAVKIADTQSRLLANVTEYELNTNRETVDITTLSDEHRQQHSSLITGSGRLTAHWDYATAYEQEPVHYLMQLVLRTEVGSAFRGKFFIKYGNTTPLVGDCRDATRIDDALWWEFDALVTASAVSFAPGQVVTGAIDFVATGPIRLHAQTQQNRFLLQEDHGKIKLEKPANSHLLLDELE